MCGREQAAGHRDKTNFGTVRLRNDRAGTPLAMMAIALVICWVSWLCRRAARLMPDQIARTAGVRRRLLMPQVRRAPAHAPTGPPPIRTGMALSQQFQDRLYGI